MLQLTPQDTLHVIANASHTLCVFMHTRIDACVAILVSSEYVSWKSLFTLPLGFLVSSQYFH
ncbi:hypothetical protein RchiOBHm_Chr6g0307321 [Rosa chinensis]|uniref:Uncharacterized protein n=1 Tax=Rosa chinensis TaxID=74649 RepID=A0A2P6Q0B4_ROSCH|nr:hypothetical protein RchiOBHm_Chr6g0307321 [Rosa chinensis]